MTHWKTLTSQAATLSHEDLGAHRPTFTITAWEGGLFKNEDETEGKAALLTVEPVKSENPSPVEEEFWASIKGKQFAARPVNCMLIEAMFGPEVETWVGHQITLGPDRVEDLFKGALQGKPCIRVMGSPELDARLRVELKMPRKTQKLVRHLEPTGERAGS